MKNFYFYFHPSKNFYFQTIAQSGILFLLLISQFSYCQSQTENPTNLLKKINDHLYMLHDMEINTGESYISIPCEVNMAVGLLEVLLCRPEGKVHESLLVTKISPLEFQTAMLLLGLDPVNEIPDDPSKSDSLSSFKTIETPGDSVLLFIESEKDGKPIRVPAESLIRDERTKTSLNQGTWLFKGAVTHQSNHVMVDNNVTIISTYSDPVALMEINSSSKFNDELFYVNEEAKLTKGQPVKLIIKTFDK
jgi:hypothetical protein